MDFEKQEQMMGMVMSGMLAYDAQVRELLRNPIPTPENGVVLQQVLILVVSLNELTRSATAKSKEAEDKPLPHFKQAFNPGLN